MPLYLLDTNILISSQEYYYPIERFPQVWHWLQTNFQEGVFKMCRENYDEIVLNDKRKKSPFGVFLRQNKSELLLNETPDAEFVRTVLAQCYAVGDDFDYEFDDKGKKRTKEQTDKLAAMSNDAFLVQYAARDPKNRIIVTYERSGGPQQPSPFRKIPVVCKELDIRCLNLLQLFEETDFKTADWPGENIWGP